MDYGHSLDRRVRAGEQPNPRSRVLVTIPAVVASFASFTLDLVCQVHRTTSA